MPGVSETNEIASELYVVPPAQFVAVRDELARTARANGNPELARELRSLRRPTQSAWLVNLLTRHELAAMEGLIALGRELREAQTGLDGTRLRRLSTQRQQMIADLLDRARCRAGEAGLRPTVGVLYEVEATLHAALVDLAASFTVQAGRLVRPMSHNGFGPWPHADVAPTARVPAPPADAPIQDVRRELRGLRLVEDELGQRRERASAEPPEHDARRPPQGAPSRSLDDGRLAAAVEPGAEGEQGLRRVETELAAAESTHWQREHDLADAEAAVEAARDRLEWLDIQRMDARRETVTAEHRLAEARSAQQLAVRAVAAARQRVEAAESRLRPDRC
jgi:hypothetical protein